MSIYLDNAATTQVCPEAARAAIDAMTENYGNPGSTHRAGRSAKKLLDASRKTVASALGCAPDELYFTSCGSESDNWAIIRGAEYNSRRGKHIISSAAEHAAVLKSLEYLGREGFEITLLSPDAGGAVSPDAVLAALRPDTCLVTLMMVNNETGAITDISAISRAVKKQNPDTLVHTDAVQAFMKVPFSAKTLGADMISICGHKIHAPKGIGGLYIKKGLNLPPYIMGGSQEESRRAGTEPIPQIAAFAAAVEAAKAAMPDCAESMASLRAHAVKRLTEENPGLVVIGGGAPNILSVSLPGYKSEHIMNSLEAKEIYVSKSSACKKGGRSHVLEAMKLDSSVIDGAVRVSLSRFTTLEEIDAFCDEMLEIRKYFSSSVRR